MMAPKFVGVGRYRESKRGIGLNMFYGLWEVSGPNQLHAGGSETPENWEYSNVLSVSKESVKALQRGDRRCGLRSETVDE